MTKNENYIYENAVTRYYALNDEYNKLLLAIAEGKINPLDGRTRE